jgi:hypothetical protein
LTRFCNEGSESFNTSSATSSVIAPALPANTGKHCQQDENQDLAKSRIWHELANSGDQPPKDAKRSARLSANSSNVFLLFPLSSGVC